MIQNNQPSLKYLIAFYDTPTGSLQPIATMQIDREDMPIKILDEDSLILINGSDYLLDGASETRTICEPEKQTITVCLGVMKAQ